MIARYLQHDVVMRVAPAASRTRAYLSAETSDAAPTATIVPSQSRGDGPGDVAESIAAVDAADLALVREALEAYRTRRV